MVEKRFELVGVSEMSIMYQGLIYLPKKRITLIVGESDKDFYSRFMVVESVKELSKVIDDPVVISEMETTTVEKPKPTPNPKPKPKTTTQTKKKTTTTSKTKK